MVLRSSVYRSYISPQLSLDDCFVSDRSLRFVSFLYLKVSGDLLNILRTGLIQSSKNFEILHGKMLETEQYAKEMSYEVSRLNALIKHHRIPRHALKQSEWHRQQSAPTDHEPWEKQLRRSETKIVSIGVSISFMFESSFNVMFGEGFFDCSWLIRGPRAKFIRILADPRTYIHADPGFSLQIPASPRE